MQRKTAMKRTASFSIVALLALTLLIAFYTPKALAEVVITGISPPQGPVGTVVTVTGHPTYTECQISVPSVWKWPVVSNSVAVVVK